VTAAATVKIHRKRRVVSSKARGIAQQAFSPVPYVLIVKKD